MDEAEKYSEAEEPLLSGDDRDPEAGVPNVPVPRSASHVSINRMHRIGSHVSSVGSARDKWEIYASVGSGAMGVSPASFAAVGSWMAGRGDRGRAWRLGRGRARGRRWREETRGSGPIRRKSDHIESS